MTRRFADRADAGRRLGAVVAALDVEIDVVLALPRGGVPVGAEVARVLGCPLDVLIVRKVGVPGHSELGMGAVSEHGIQVLNRQLIGEIGISNEQIAAVVRREQEELDRRVAAYRAGRAMLPVAGKSVVVVDDGLATGFTARAAIQALRELEPTAIVLAVPVAAPDTIDEMRTVADAVATVETPTRLRAVGQWYRDFSQVSDRAVVEILGSHLSES